MEGPQVYAGTTADRKSAESLSLSNTRWRLGLLLGIGIVAAAVRLYQLSGRSLWLDEVTTAQSAHFNTLSEVIDQTHVYFNQMPLYYIVTWLLRPLGDSEFMLRLPSVVAGTLTVLAVYLLGRSLFGTRVGLVGSLLTAVLPYAVWYSQEARNYALLMFLTTMQMYFAYTAVKRGRVTDWLGLALFTTLNLYTHYLAFVPTAAIAAYISLSLMVDLLRRASNRARVVTVSALLALALVAALVPWRPVLRAAYLDLRDVLIQARHHPATVLAIAAVLVAIVVVVGVLLRRRLQDALRRMPDIATRLALAAGAAALVAIAYAPWLPSLKVVLGRPDVTVGTIRLGRSPGVTDVLDVLNRLGISGIVLAALCIGLVAVVVWSFRGRTAQSALLLCWLGVSLAVLLRSAGASLVTIDLRYLAFLIPAAMLVTGVAIEVVALAFDSLSRRVWPRGSSRVRLSATVAAIPLVGLLLVQMLPALAASYQMPKDDWRGAAEHIVAASPRGSVVLAVGDFYPWTLLSLDYYFHRLHSSAVLIDGLQVNSDVAAILANTHSKVWGVIVFPSAEQRDWIARSSEEKTDYVDVTGHIYVVQAADPGLSTIDQARALLKWEMPLQPQLGASVNALDLYTGKAGLGPDLVRVPAAGALGWSFGPSVSPDAAGVVFTPNSAMPELNATFTTALDPGGNFNVSFEWLNASLNGWQKVYVLALDQSLHVLDVFPSGGGYACERADSWKRSYFAFRPPPGTQAATLILRVNGSGTAAFRKVQVNRILDVQ